MASGLRATLERMPIGDPLQRRLAVAVQILCFATALWAVVALVVAHVRDVLDPFAAAGGASFGRGAARHVGVRPRRRRPPEHRGDLQHFLQKPFTSQRLLEKVRAVLDAR